MNQENTGQIRQGDILLKPIERIDVKNMKKIADDRYVLAYGETTGHSHVMKGDVDFYDSGNGMVLCQVKGKTELIHEEHGNIEIPSNDYIVIRQREVDIIEGVRRVSD